MDHVPDAKGLLMPLQDMACRSFFFGPDEVALLRSRLQPRLRKHATRFDIVVGSLAGLCPGDEDGVHRPCPRPRGVPGGYYGNAFTTPVAISTAHELRTNPVSYAVELVKKAKDVVDMEYMRSAADATVLRKRMHGAPSTCVYSVSDTTRAKSGAGLDFGWGQPVYGGPAQAVGFPMLPWISSFLLPSKNSKGDHGVLVSLCLPTLAMDRMVDEMAKLLHGPANDAALILQQIRVNKRSAL